MRKITISNGKSSAVISYRTENKNVTYTINKNGSCRAAKTNKANFLKMVINFNF